MSPWHRKRQLYLSLSTTENENHHEYFSGSYEGDIGNAVTSVTNTMECASNYGMSTECDTNTILREFHTVSPIISLKAQRVLKTFPVTNFIILLR
jgi:hypothetical protein